MAIKPILFNTDMVKAILGGRKTQTRRIIKGIDTLNVYHAEPAEDAYETLGAWDFFYGWSQNGAMIDAIQRIKAPCSVGDVLWVRETFDDVSMGHPWYYKADGDLRPECWKGERWIPSIHMPKEAARIFLKVKGVRVKRLQDITVLDAINEGCSGIICNHVNSYPALGCMDCFNTGWLEAPDTEFAFLWDTTVNKANLSVYGWDANPWVWVIEFERCEKPEWWCRDAVLGP